VTPINEVITFESVCLKHLGEEGEGLGGTGKNYGLNLKKMEGRIIPGGCEAAEKKGKGSAQKRRNRGPDLERGVKKPESCWVLDYEGSVV